MPYTNNEMIVRTLRAQAWDRAKGELQASLSTFWDGDIGHGSQYSQFSAAINEFVKHVEDNGLHE